MEAIELGAARFREVLRSPSGSAQLLRCGKRDRGSRSGAQSPVRRDRPMLGNPRGDAGRRLMRIGDAGAAMTRGKR
jgi:hypothetical protein